MFDHLSLFFNNRRSVAIGAGFFVLGFLFGNWATLIPYIKYTYNISDSVLGLLLLCLPLGAMTFNPVAAWLIRKFGMQKISVAGMFIISIAYLLPFVATTFYMVPVGLVFVGISMTTLNISINTAATNFEQIENKSIMSTCHGMFSIGLMTGSLMRSLTLLAGIHEITHMMVMSTASIAIGLITFRTLLSLPTIVRPAPISDRKTKITIPKGTFLSIIIISLCVNVTEGSMSDWASLYMKEIVHTNAYFVGWGLFGYSAFMAIGRLFGDGIIPVYGRNNVLVYGALLAASGLMVTILFPYTWSAIVGFALVGLGVSCGAPILYGSASRHPDMSDAGGLAVMNTYAMGGFLLGPVVIGFISDITSLPVAFGFVSLLAMLWLYKSRHARLY